MDYRQRNWSLGAEMELALTPRLLAEIGAGYERVEYLETGDKPAREDFDGPTGRLGLIWAASPQWRFRAAIGYKVRTPTMRELFGEALNRFLLNPDLESERITTAELAAEWQGQEGGFYIIPFAQDLNGAIDQRNVANPTPPPSALRQRINLRGARVRGVEVGGALALGANWTVRGRATYADARRLRSSAAETSRLAEKPELLADLVVRYEPPSGFGAQLEIDHMGRAYSVDPTGALIALDASTEVNIELSHAFSLRGDARGEIYVRADNVSDELVTPQFALPAPGRLVRAGVRYAW